MSKTTKSLIARFRRKLTRVILLEQSHCGYESDIQKAASARVAMEFWLMDEIEAVVQKAGLP